MEIKGRGKSATFFVMDVIDYFLQTVQTGDLILTVQDGFVVGVEKKEKFIITAKERDARYSVHYKSTQNPPFKNEILAELEKIKYGQLVIRVEKGEIGKIEKTEKWRTDELKGINGDGI